MHGLDISPLEQGDIEGEIPVYGLAFMCVRYSFYESGCLGLQP